MRAEPEMARLDDDVLGSWLRVSSLQCQETTPSVRLQIEVVGTGGGDAQRTVEIVRVDLDARWRIHKSARRWSRADGR